MRRYDAFRPTKRCEQSSIHFEKAAILFNLGALQSQIALQTERTTDAGVKEAAKLFQVRFATRPQATTVPCRALHAELFKCGSPHARQVELEPCSEGTARKESVEVEGWEFTGMDIYFRARGIMRLLQRARG